MGLHNPVWGLHNPVLVGMQMNVEVNSSLHKLKVLLSPYDVQVICVYSMLYC